MNSKRNYRNFTDEDLIKIGKQYSRRTDFRSGDRSAYFAAIRRNLMDEIIPPQSKIKDFESKKEDLKKLALSYKTRKEMELNDNAAYSKIHRWGIADECFSHMIPIHTSFPQKVLKTIASKLFNLEPLYNTRKILKNFELDVYFPSLRIAFEFDGYRYHSDPKQIERDNRKNLACLKQNILLIRIKEEKSNKLQGIVIFIKNQLLQQLNIINEFGMFNFKSEDVENIIVGKDDLNSDFYDINSIKNIIARCETYVEFQNQHKKEYEFLRKHNLLSLTNHFPKKKRSDYGTNEDILRQALSFSSYSLLVKNFNFYKVCFRRGLLPLIKKSFEGKSS